MYQNKPFLILNFKVELTKWRGDRYNFCICVLYNKCFSEKMQSKTFCEQNKERSVLKNHFV